MTSDETPNPNTTEQCREEEEEAPPTPHSDPLPPKTLALLDPDSTTLDPDPDTLTEDPTHTQITDDPEPETPSATATSLRRAPKRKRPAPRRPALEKKLRLLNETLIAIPFAPSKALDFDAHKSLLQRLGLWDFAHLDFGPALRGDLVAELIACYAPAKRCSYVSGIRIKVSRSDLSRALKLPAPKLHPPKKNAATVVAEGGEESVDSRESIAFVYEFVSNWMLLHDDDMHIMSDEVSGYLNSIGEGKWERVDWAALVWLMVEKELSNPKLGNCYYASHLQHLIKSQHKELLEEEAPLVVEDEVVEVKDEEEEVVEVKDEEEEAVVKDEGEEVEVKDEGEEAELKDEGEEAKLKDEGEEAELKDEGGVVGVKDEGHRAEVEAKDEKEEEVEEVEEVDGSDVKMGEVDIDEIRDHELEENSIGLSLGPDNVERVEVEKEQGGEERMMVDFEECKEEEEEEEEEQQQQQQQHGMWLMDQRINVGGSFLRQCHNVDVNGMESDLVKEEDGEDGQEQEEEDEDGDEDENEGGFHLSRKCSNLFEGMPSGTGSIIHAMDAVQMPFSSGIDLHDNPGGDFLSSRDDPQMIS